jgi:hypothetical protein
LTANSKDEVSFSPNDEWIVITTISNDRLQRENSEVKDLYVTSDRERLVVLGEKNLSMLRRPLYLWGIAFHTFSWPPLGRRTELWDF